MFYVWKVTLREHWLHMWLKLKKIGPETRADDIKNDESDRENTGKSVDWLRWNELNDYPYLNNKVCGFIFTMIIFLSPFQYGSISFITNTCNWDIFHKESIIKKHVLEFSVSDAIENGMLKPNVVDEGDEMEETGWDM